MFRFFAILLLVPAIMASGEISISACRNGGPLPNWVTIAGCNLESCTISASNGLKLGAEFTSQSAATELKVALTAFILTREVDIPLLPEVQNGCNIVSCPVEPNRTLTFEVETKPQIPPLGIGRTLPVELSIVNENAQRVFCVRTTVSIVE